MSTNATVAQPAEHTLDAGIDLMQLLTLFVVEWRVLVIVSAILFAIGAAFVYSITPLYEASATLLPQAQAQSASVADLFSTRSPGDIFIGLLASRSLQDEVVDRAGLLELYHTSSRAAARGLLTSRSVFSVGRDTLVMIRVRDQNAEAAMRITNTYLDALEDQREKMLHSQAVLHDRFFQQQLTQEADALAAAERELKEVQLKTGLVMPEAQTSIGLNAIAGTRAQITGLQVQLSALLMGASEQNPQVKSLRAQIGQLQAQEHTLESASSGTASGAAASAKLMPGLNLDYTRKLREVRYHEALFTSISNQFESAKLSEGYTGTPFVVIDEAVVPEEKAYPPRRPLLWLVFGASVLSGVLCIGLLLLWRRLRAEPLQRERMAAIRRSFHLRRSGHKQAA